VEVTKAVSADRPAARQVTAERSARLTSGPVFGGGLLSIIFLFILAVAFYLLHRMVRAFRVGWRPGRPRPRSPSTGGPS
jgi:hypothetical protein